MPKKLYENGPEMSDWESQPKGIRGAPSDTPKPSKKPIKFKGGEGDPEVDYPSPVNSDSEGRNYYKREPGWTDD